MEAMRTDRVANPEFAVVVRGYDRTQVDEYLGELLAWLSEAERRILAADEANEALRRELVQLRATAASLEERAGVPGPQSLSAFSERMNQLMQSAVEAANELRGQAEREANERRDAVAAEVERMLERAKTEAREILRRARAKERELEESIVGLAERRAAAVDQLARLHRELSELLARPEAAAGPAADGAAHPATAEGSRASGYQAELPPPTGDQPVPVEGDDPAGVTRALPAVQPEPMRTPEPTMVQYPTGDRRSDRGGRR